MKVNAFIFARGGSKGLPRKNIKLLSGKPLIQYSIEIAKQAKIDRVFVSTEDKEIATIAQNLGAEIIHRPDELASDTCSEWLAWRHAVEHVYQHYGLFDLFVSLPPTSPLRSVNDVNNAIELLCCKEGDVCISTTKANRSPFFNMIKNNEAGFCELINKPDKSIGRRQDAPKVFDMTTVVYVTRPHFILNHNSIFEGKVVNVDVPKVRAVDIDDIYDFLLAEAILKSKELSDVE